MIARLAAKIHFCRTVIVETDQPHVIRRRRHGSNVAVSFGNALLSLKRDPVRFLHEQDWLEHEVAMYRATGVAVPVQQNRTIRLPIFPGKTLADHLRHSDLPTQAIAFQICVESLRRLHMNGGSHGDAHAGNVLADVEGESAQWIDFETRHTRSVSASFRFADDLRALIASSLALAGNDLSREMIKSLRTIETTVVHLLLQMIRHPSRSLLHRAQGDLPAGVRRTFGDLLAALRKDAG